MKKFLCIAVSLSLSLSLSACAKPPSSQEAQPDSPSIGQSTAASEAAPEQEIEYQTYEIPIFGIEFDCPADFASDVESNVISDSEVGFKVKGTEDGVIYVTCLRNGYFKSLDATISTYENTYEAFELLGCFSTSDGYGFYYIGTDSFGDAPSTELGYQYKNHGGFVDDGGIIQVQLSITVPETVDREKFISFCETVTSSLRLSGSDTGDSTSSAEMGESSESVLEPLKDGTYEEQCAEIVDTLFHYAPLVCYDGPRLKLMRLFDGNEELFKSLEYRGGLLEGEDNFTSELVIQACGEIDITANAYYINVNEIRTYYGIESGTGEYRHTICITINSSTDYCVTGVDSDYYGPVDNGYKESTSGEAAGSFVSIYDDEDGIYGGPPDSEFFGPGDVFKGLNPDIYQLPELEAQRTYGANAQIDDDTFYNVLLAIKKDDEQWAVYNRYQKGVTALGPSTLEYEVALDLLESRGFTNTPLYELALYRYSSAVLVAGID